MKEYIIHAPKGLGAYEEEYISSFGKPIERIIRCKDCVYFTPEKSGEHWNVCKFYDAPKTADGYCNDAEPKEIEQ